MAEMMITDMAQNLVITSYLFVVVFLLTEPVVSRVFRL